MSDAHEGIILLQMGGPETLADIEPFLYQVFADPDIIRYPFFLKPFQRTLARRIARKRAAGPVRDRYAAMGNGSPLGRETAAQAALVEKITGKPTAVAMRYTDPRATDALAALRAAGCTSAVAVTLYPHYSGSTTGSSVNDLARAIAADDHSSSVSSASSGASVFPVRVVRSWATNAKYVALVAAQLESALEDMRQDWDGDVHVALSAHGIPQSYVRAGDPYPREVEATRDALAPYAEKLGYASVSLSYQSKIGPVKWLKPYTDEALAALAAKGAKAVVTVPFGFVSDHIETLYDLDVLYKEKAESLGFERYLRLPAFNDDPRFGELLADLATKAPSEPLQVSA
ncbi:MAG: ferrochelatase [Thermoplasmatota archaeon]